MKKLKTIIGLWSALVIVLTMGCVEKFEADVNAVPNEGLVVEGNIISDSTVVFLLSKTLPLDVTPELLESFTDVDAKLSVKGTDGSCWIGHQLEEGQYQVEIGTLKPDVEYHLEILYNGDTYQSTPQKPLENVGIEKLSFSQLDLDSPVIIQVDTRKSENPQYCLWYFEEDWEIRAVFPTDVLYDFGQERVVFYDYPPVAQGWFYRKTDQVLLGTSEANVENQIVGKHIQTIENTDRRLSVLYSIRVQQRNLTPQEYEYYQVRVKYSDEMGGLFTPQPTELPTNITCSDASRKVIGYVGCNMGISERQLYISEKEVSYFENFRCEVGIGLPESDKEKYLAGYQVAISTPMGREWAPTECVDVTLLGADPNGRPSWWPNPYIYR